MSKSVSWISSNLKQLTHFFKKNLHLYKNSWGVCILADLNCGEGETVFNKEVEKIVAELKKEQRNYYLTLIINAEFGFFEKLEGISDNAFDKSELKTVIYQNSPQPILIDFQDFSQREIVKTLITRYFYKESNSKYTSVITWGHGTAYSIFKKLGNEKTLDTEPTPEDIKGHFLMNNDEQFKELFLAHFKHNTLPDNKPNNLEKNKSEVSDPISSKQSKNYLSMDELALAIRNVFGRKIDLVVLSNCGMSYMRTGITISKVTDYWVAGEKNINLFGILPDNLLSALEKVQELSPLEFSKTICPANSDTGFRLYQMKYFKPLKKILENFSKAIYVNIRANHTILMEARRNCSPLDNESKLFHLISFFDYCDKLLTINSAPPHGIIFLQGFCRTLLKMKNKLILSHSNDNFGLSIFFPPNLEMLNIFDIDNKEIIDLPENTKELPVPYTPYLWEYNVIKLLERNQ